MNRFQAIKSITDERKFSELIFDLIKYYDTGAKLAEFLKEELQEKELQTLQSIAQTGYPLSLERKQ